MHRLISQSNDIIKSQDDNFPMGCTFSPDGTCILTATSYDGKFRLYDTPFQYLTGDDTDDDDKIVKDITEGAGTTAFDCIDESINRDNNSDDNDKTSSTSGVISTSIASSKLQINTQAEIITTYSHNQNYQPPPSPSITQQHTTANNNEQQYQPHQWSASLTSHLGGPSPSSSSASYSWYPLMSSSSPLTSLYVTCRGHSLPIHLIDAYTSQLRASYRPYNNVDEMEGPTVVEFSPDGTRILGTGFKSDRTICVFDTSIPGKDGMIVRLGKTRRSNDGQKGIPSSIAFPKNNDSGGGPMNVFAVGTYSPSSIYIYDDRCRNSNFTPAGTIVLHGGLTVVGHGRKFTRKKRRFDQLDDQQKGSDEEEDNSNLFSSARVNWFQSRARGGITQLTWSPSTSNNPYVLYSASRKSNTVLSWDIRCLSGSTQHHKPICGLQSYGRDGSDDTNQRLEFDIDDCGKRIFVGCGSGVVKIYNVNSGMLEDTIDVCCTANSNRKKDAVNGVSYFNSDTAGNGNGLLAVAVGSRRYDDHELDVDDNEDRWEGVRDTDKCPGFLQLYKL